MLIFTFDVPVELDEVHLLDIDEQAGAQVRAFGPDGQLITAVDSLTPGDNSFQSLAIDAAEVARLEVDLSGSGAVTDLVFSRDGQHDVRLVGGRVFDDANRNGQLDAGEPGVGGVVLDLMSPTGQNIGAVTTEASGQYFFTVIDGAYRVEVADASFETGGVLAGMVSTTGGNMQVLTVAGVDMLTLDLGYADAAAPAPGVRLLDGVLAIVGTEDRDRVKISADGPELLVRSKFSGDPWQQDRFDIAEIAAIDVILLGGNDALRIGRNVDIPAVVDGGAGNDVLRGGSGDDSIRGGSGIARVFTGKRVGT